MRANCFHELVRATSASGHFLALIDGSDSFDPESLGNECLRHLLWIRCRQGLEAIKVTDLLLRDGNFPLVIVDLVLNAPAELRKIPQTTWYRLQRLVEAVPVACLVLGRQNMIEKMDNRKSGIITGPAFLSASRTVVLCGKSGTSEGVALCATRWKIFMPESD